MKKLDKKLHLHRETVRQLDSRELRSDDVARVRGGVVWTGCMSDCTQCTGPVPVYTFATE